MAKLPGWSWLAIGLLIALISWYVELRLFFWIGWLFIVVGAASFLIGFVTRKKESPIEKKIMKQTMPPQHHHYYKCNCGNTVRKVDNFCSWCGKRLK